MLYMEFYLRDRAALLGDRPALMDIIEKTLINIIVSGKLFSIDRQIKIHSFWQLKFHSYTINSSEWYTPIRR